MARTGIPQIDGLLGGDALPPLGATNAPTEAVSFIHDLLIGQQFGGIPGPLGSGRGMFGPRTADAIVRFQRMRGLPTTGTVDRATLQAFLQHPWPRPFACCGYVAVLLDVEFTGLVRLVSITSQFEGGGLFTAINRNTDGAGLSFGLIQWAQKPGRLHELLFAFHDRQPRRFVDLLGGGDAALAQGLLAHTALPRGGTDARGVTVDPRFDLTGESWVARFRAAGSDPALQRIQLDVAVEAFTRTCGHVQTIAPQVQSERGIAFLLDVANQHGDGGAADIVRCVQQPAMTEPELLAAVERESVSRVRAQFGDRPEVASTLNRRQAFRTTALLSDQPLVLA